VGIIRMGMGTVKRLIQLMLAFLFHPDEWWKN
jgi:hypothetical protein